MDNCSYGRFNGKYNQNNGNVWFFGKCFQNIMEVIKIVDDIPAEFDDFMEIFGITCFINNATEQIWYNFKTYDNVEKAYQALCKILNKGSGKTPIRRNKKSHQDLEYLSL